MKISLYHRNKREGGLYMSGLYSFLFAIFGVIIFAPLVWSVFQSVTVTLLTSASILLTAPLMWCVNFMHDRKLNNIKAELEKAKDQNQSEAAVYILNMKYQECEERREKIAKFIINTSIIVLCAGLFMWIL